MNTFLKVIRLVCVILLPFLTNGQSNFQSISLISEYGHIFSTNTFVAGTNAVGKPLSNYTAFAVNASWNFKKGSEWNEVYSNLVYGVGAYGANFPDKKEVGVPLALYGFVQSNITKIGLLDLRYEIDLGMAFNWRYLGISNTNNVAVSLPRTVFVDFGLMLDCFISKDIIVGFGTGISHFSNGGTRRPNAGINTSTFKGSIKYSLNPYQTKTGVLPPFEPKTQVDLAIFAGYHNFQATAEDLLPEELFEGVNANVAGVYATLNRKNSRKSRFGIGLGVTYDEGLTTQVGKLNGEPFKIKKKGVENIEASAHLSYEFTVGKVSMLLQQGIYFYRRNNNILAPPQYHRLGARFNFHENLFVGASLRAYEFKKANFIEYTIGRRF
jgi:hypothetical protein